MGIVERLPGPLDHEWDWQRRAQCRDPKVKDLFITPYDEDPRDRDAREEKAKKVCNTPCPVRVTCLNFALRTREPNDIWGGATPRERRKVLRILDRQRQG